MIYLTLWGLLIAALGGFYRVVVGPTVPDRIVAADAMTVIITTALAVLSLVFENGVFLDIALAFAILSFADVLIMAKYFEHGELHK
ncbi:multiple resistance and pH regulation protein F [Thermovirga lienii DSM 17291]|jgi:multicomponent Na+:H+ antiporter subunit F|uniref:Multiple resistance and pH regulation protein F n=1 Tax=Thermovirga lienii (strain ATCC BAA-1197 / DSM 17291 / Cas60314) TaxID=580340 RepID=G7V7X3_THELD|nr:monovalent cation/H+ antiporter complex subunit F [Thermovirga lienii]AER66209.1 multiple resistance and pH regulation protein F [Thermovirga lienii DSM 17291]MDN5368526.1 multicomponent Na+:H+ antiporter subunit [Thermovirga sp.]